MEKQNKKKNYDGLRDTIKKLLCLFWSEIPKAERLMMDYVAPLVDIFPFINHKLYAYRHQELVKPAENESTGN